MVRRSYTRWIKDFEQALGHPPKGDPSTTLPALAWDAYAFHEQIRKTPQKAAALEYATAALDKKSANEVYGALCFFDHYFNHAQTEREMPEQLIGHLLETAEKTTKRSHAAAALDILVQYGAIGEFEAMDRMDDWKEKNLPQGW